MPKNKDLKRRVRARMRKTGESYTAARAQLLSKRSPRTSDALSAGPDVPGPSVRSSDGEAILPTGYAARARMSDEAVQSKTGRTWAEWVELLDSVGAVRMPHSEIARFVREEHGIGRWWTQMVAVGYERIRGLRQVGQRRDGTFEANRSKTFPVPVTELYRAFSQVRRRRQWLPGVDLELRKCTSNKSMRLLWEDGTPVEIYFEDKGDAKSRVAIQQRRLPTKAAAEEAKDYWAERLTALAEMLTAP